MGTKYSGLLAGSRHNDTTSEQGPVLKPFEALAIGDDITEYCYHRRLDIQGDFSNVVQFFHNRFLASRCFPAHTRHRGGVDWSRRAHVTDHLGQTDPTPTHHP